MQAGSSRVSLRGRRAVSRMPSSCTLRVTGACLLCALITLHVESAGAEQPHHLGGVAADAPSSSKERLPWVFMLQYDSDEQQKDLMKAAVLSSIKNGKGSLIPFCMYRGPANTDAYNWMREQGVTVIQHTPSWQDKFWNDVESWINRQKNPERPSPSTKLHGKDAILGTFMRVDIPILEELKSFEYALYTDTDIYFRGPVRMSDIGFSPKTIAMARPTRNFHAKENSNAGVMLLNLTALRETYDDFLSMLLGRSGKIDFGRFGPFDQGAYNFYYAASKMKLPDGYNYRPVGHNFRYSSAAANEAVIIHFPGHTKPVDVFHGDAVMEHKLNSYRHICKFLVKDRYFEMLGKMAEQASVDKQSVCHPGQPSRHHKT